MGATRLRRGSWNLRMHAEHYRLVNPMEKTVSADTQLALAA